MSHVFGARDWRNDWPVGYDEYEELLGGEELEDIKGDKLQFTIK